MLEASKTCARRSLALASATYLRTGGGHSAKPGVRLAGLPRAGRLQHRRTFL